MRCKTSHGAPSVTVRKRKVLNSYHLDRILLKKLKYFEAILLNFGVISRTINKNNV